MDPLTTVFLLFGFIGLGVLSRVLMGNNKLFNSFMNALNKFIYYILLPIVFLDTFASRGVELADINIALTAFIYVVISVVVLLKIPLNHDHELRNSVVITSIFQNNVFLGFPVLLIMFNDISAAAMYSLVIFILHITIAGLLAARRENILVSILEIPVIYGFIAGTIIHYTIYEQYQVLTPITAYTHSLLSYSAVYVLGYTLPLTLAHVKQYMKALYITGLWRFLASPLIHYTILLFLTIPNLYWKEIMILSIMPPAVMNTVIAKVYNWKPELVASITLILTLTSLIIIAAIILIQII